MAALMKKPNKETTRMAIIVTLILIAYIPVLSWWIYHIPVHVCFAYLRNIIYIGLFAFWGISINRRIIQKQAKRYLITIAGLMVFWILIRTVKWYFVSNIHIERYLWYAFYIPVLLIPVLGIFVVLSLGKPEGYRLPKAVDLVLLPATILLILVLTNDFHQLTFIFPDISQTGGVRSDDNYSYNIGYFLIVGWSLLIALATLGLMHFKCRVPRTRKIIYQPFIPLAILIAYSILYALSWEPLRLFARDMTIVFCLLIAAIWESCIRKGLIQSNSRYDELFQTSAIGAQIIDNGGNVFLASVGAVSADEELLFKAQAEPVLLSDGIRLSSTAVKGGHVVWHEDVSQLARLLEELQDTNEHLQGRNITLQEEYATRRQLHHLTEQNRIYNKMQNQTQEQIRLLTGLVDRLEARVDAREEEKLLAKIAVVSAYIKRRNNLIFLSEDNNAIPAAELKYCFNESIQNLTLFGVSCDYFFAVDGTLPFSEMMCIYDVFEAVIEKAFDTLTSLYLYAGRDDYGITMTMRLSSGADLSCLGIENLAAEAENDGEWQLSFRIPKRGDSL